MSLFNFFRTRAYIVINESERKLEIKGQQNGELFGYALMDESISQIKMNIRKIGQMFSLKITNQKMIWRFLAESGEK